MVAPKPLLRWVGGKTAVTDAIIGEAACVLGCNRGQLLDRRLVEPFCGALGFSLEWLRLGGKLHRAQLSDQNEALVRLHQAVRDDPKGFGARLDGHPWSQRPSETYYYEVRDRFNRSRSPEDLVWLNAFCFNGLYRENRLGKFNVPIGERSSYPERPSDEVLGALSASLRDVHFTTFGYQTTIDWAGPGDLVYADPPYHGTHSSYGKKGFTDADHTLLAESLSAAAGRGALVVASNSLDPFTAATFGRSRDFRFGTVQAPRSVSRDGAGRGSVSEAVFVAGEP